MTPAREGRPDVPPAPPPPAPPPAVPAAPALPPAPPRPPPPPPRPLAPAAPPVAPAPAPPPPPPPPQAAIHTSASAARVPLIGPQRVITAHECRLRAEASLESKVVDQEAHVRGPPRPAREDARRDVDQHLIGRVGRQGEV